MKLLIQLLLVIWAFNLAAQPLNRILEGAIRVWK